MEGDGSQGWDNTHHTNLQPDTMFRVTPTALFGNLSVPQDKDQISQLKAPRFLQIPHSTTHQTHFLVNELQSVSLG
ncbi:hypothetical protein AAFF_G00296860 [Aldrovandia affinis]|uniref:Uncharacterized protein n=1 Tax=Aldrovandia affinis TaxID=143900 RepID=A0AAD7WRW6_9TELE|nr:hypothetical protein AAFF_G00296860 [Aldrovandia affinis]